MSKKEEKMFQTIGWIGMVLLLSNYAAVSTGHVLATGVTYNMVQLVAALALATSVWPAKAWPVIITNLVFVLIGAVAIFAALF